GSRCCTCRPCARACPLRDARRIAGPPRRCRRPAALARGLGLSVRETHARVRLEYRDVALVRDSDHCTISSALATRDCGIVNLSVLTALRLITSSNWVGCSMGNSPGLVPLRILSTKYAARRYMSRI